MLASERARLLDQAARLESAASVLQSAGDTIDGEVQRFADAVGQVHGRPGGWMGPAADQSWSDAQAELTRARSEQGRLHTIADQLRSRATQLRHQAS